MNNHHDLPPDAVSPDIPDTPPERGLTRQQAAELLATHGYNEVLEEKPHPLRLFLKKFWGISAWMLELIMLLSLLLHKYEDFYVVSVLLVINAVLGFLQEQRAAGAVEALRQRLQVNARVLRDALWHNLPARELVPGDIIRLRAGDIIPADVKLLQGSLRIDQSALTGESADVGKEAASMLSSGSLVRHGEGTAVVILTGSRTYFGRTTQLVQSAHPKLHIEAVVSRLVRWMFLIVSLLLIMVLLLSQLRHLPLLDLLPLLLVLLMSAVPVALPVMFTVSMAIGARELARRGVLVTRLSAIEDAATMDVLCTDKTGTITQNRLALSSLFPLAPADAATVLHAAALASQASNQDPIDLAVLDAAREQDVIAHYPPATPVAFTPFDAASRHTEALVEIAGKQMRYLKGAVHSLAVLCKLDAVTMAQLEAEMQRNARQGYRTLAVASGDASGPLQMLGLLSFSDPPRADAAQLIAKLQQLGIRVKMQTGDALAVASEVARRVGLADIRPVAELKAGIADHSPATILQATGGFAEVFPEDKYLVMQQLQAAGHVSGMTGDGVNDAPALRQAEVGIAVSNATDVARAAASVVLTDPGLTNIVSLVEHGRVIYQRILTWIINKVSRTILKAGFVSVAFVITGKFVVSAFAMLLLVFMTDFAKISLSTDQARASQQPESWNIGGHVIVAAILGIAMVLEAIALLALEWQPLHLATNDNNLFTLSFLTLLFMAAFSILSARERGHFWASRPGRVLSLALLADILIGTLLTYSGLRDLQPLPTVHLFYVFCYAIFACLLVNDTLKVFLLRKLAARGS